MPFSAREFNYAWRHIGLGVVRRLTQQSEEKYINVWRQKGVPMRTLVYEGAVQRCQFCGYALAEVDLPPEGWLIQACSAVGFDSLIGNERLSAWTKVIGLTQPERTITAEQSVLGTTSATGEAFKSGLPTIGV
jgi:hypothetical protein